MFELSESDLLVQFVNRVLAMSRLDAPPSDFDDVFSSNIVLDNPNIWKVIKSLEQFRIERIVNRSTKVRALFQLVKGLASVNLAIMLTPETQPKIQTFLLQ